jgi:hypothetical protein
METMEIVGLIILLLVLVSFRVLSSFWIARQPKRVLPLILQMNPETSRS